MYSPMDADSGCTSSGSADSTSLTNSIDQCVNLTSGSVMLTYRFKAKDSGGGSGLCYANFYSIPCPNSISDFDSVTGSISDVLAPSSGSWVQAPKSALTSLPAGTKSVHVFCVPMQGFGYYDQIYLGASTSVTF
jgi:hypothetical protein